MKNLSLLLNKNLNKNLLEIIWFLNNNNIKLIMCRKVKKVLICQNLFMMLACKMKFIYLGNPNRILINFNEFQDFHFKTIFN